MAVSPSPPVTLTTKSETNESEISQIQSTQPPDPPLQPPPSTSSPSPSLPVVENPSSNPPPTTSFPSFQSFTPAAIPPPSAPSFRPLTSFPQPTPQFTPLPNPNVHNPSFQNPQPQPQPPGVNPVSIMLPGSQTSGVGAVTVSVSPLRPPGAMYQMPPGQPPNPYGQMPNGYSTIPPPAPQGTIPPPGVPRYPTAYTPMVRPPFPPRPPGTIGMLQPLGRPPVPGIRGVPPVAATAIRPIVPIVAPTEKPQTTVYVGKIASTVENDFILSLLRLCGPVKSWKRAQDPSNGAPRGFGFCEFESAEGVLRALRLLSKFSVDGQELVLNVNQATREYLERYVEKKTEREKQKELEAEAAKKDEECAPGVEKNEPSKSNVDNSAEKSSENKETQDGNQNFGIVTDEDRESDKEALEKLQNMLEERLKAKPLPPPPTQPPPDSSAKSNSEAKSRDGDSDVDIMKNGDEKNDDEMTSDNKPSSEQERPETHSPDRNRKYDRRSRERDRERDLKREKERELERYERERERERVRRERDREQKIREAERAYKERLKDWESRERDMAYQRQTDREREKERERERRREIMDQEDESDDDDRKRRRRSSVHEEKRKKRKREKEEDVADRLKEEEEIEEAKQREIEEQQKRKEDAEKEDAMQVSSHLINGSEKSVLQEEATAECRSNGVEQSYASDSGIVNHSDDVIMKNGIEDDSAMLPVAMSDTRQSSNAPTRKLGFGLVGSGKRTAVPSVFHEEDEDDEDKEKKMRPLVPIDYSTEELQAVQTPTSGTPPPNLAAAAEFAKRISNVNPKDERSESERDRNRRPSDRSSNRERDRNDEDRHRSRDEYTEKTTDRDREREHAAAKVKAQENKKLLDAKQLIDMIPKTKEELFSYEINWTVYDKHGLHERMRPWISKKITEFLGEEETTLVDYIVSRTKDHVRASEMLELLQSILDDEAEMFVLKMWRMLIFEIKKVETGLAVKPKA